MTEETFDVGMLYLVKSCNSSIHDMLEVRMQFIKVLQDQSIKNFNGDDDLVNGIFLDDLEVSTYVHANGHIPGSFDVEYRSIYLLDLRLAEKMVKSLRKIDSHLKRMRNQFGRPTTFGQFVARVGQVTKTKFLVFQSEGTSSDYRNNRYRFLEVGLGVDKIDQEVGIWAETEREKMEDK